MGFISKYSKEEIEGLLDKVQSGKIEGSGGYEGANVAAIDTNDILDEVNINYATTEYVDSLIGLYVELV